MTSSNIEFVYQDRIFEVKDPDSNETLLNYIRTKLKKIGTKERLCRRWLWRVHCCIR